MADPNRAEDVRLGVYMRVSTSDQKKQDTIETQRGVLACYIDRDDLAGAVYGWYEDEAVSGYKIAFAQRPSGARLMADIRAGHVNIILVRKLDRLGRNAREILNAVHEIEAVGARLISLKENVDTRTSAGRFFLTVLAGVAQLEAEMIAERTDEGRVRRLESTSWMGGKPPYGYRILGERKDSRLIIDDVVDTESGYSERDVMRLAWHLLVEEDWPTDRIAAYLTETSIPTRDGKPAWAPRTVWRLERCGVCSSPQPMWGSMSSAPKTARSILIRSPRSSPRTSGSAPRRRSSSTSGTTAISARTGTTSCAG